MTGIDERHKVQQAWAAYNLIECKSRRGGGWQPCAEPPYLWDWRAYQYRDAGDSPVHLLFAELKQAGDDGEACIFSQVTMANVCQYLEAQR